MFAGGSAAIVGEGASEGRVLAGFLEALGVPLAPLERWMHSVGWEMLINRKGTTWRKLDADQQAAVHDAASARELMLAQPSVIRRPVLEHPGGLRVGFDAGEWGRALG